MSLENWICCQLGAREHYAVPRSLRREGRLERLYTDLWTHPASFRRKLSRALAERFHQDLANAAVTSFNASTFAFEAVSRLRRRSGWNLISQRNNWFQQRVASELARRYRQTSSGTPPAVFAYSYAARRIIESAHDLGWRTVLGQIDAGPVEEGIVARLYDENPEFRLIWQPAPAEYWEQWRRECALAGIVVVNSSWSRHALVMAGIPEAKIRVVPLAVEPAPDAEAFKRTYPAAFTRSRPLRILFLGQIELRKGIAPILEAAMILRDEPVEFHFVGPVHISLPVRFKHQSHIHWTGPVARSYAAAHYRDADVFLFPTFSDGFGLTQLEAQAWKLPIIASRNCGEVVRDGINGAVLQQVSAASIEQAIRGFLRCPALIREMSLNSSIDRAFKLESLAAALLTV